MATQRVELLKQRLTAWLTPGKSNLILAGLGLASLLLYWFFLTAPLDLASHFAITNFDSLILFQGGWKLSWRMVFFFLVEIGLYGLAWWVARRAAGRHAWWIVICGALAMGLVLLFMHPFDAADIFDNIIHGRILGIYHANPFIQTAENYPQDPFYPFVGWKAAPTAYGPAWELMAGPLAVLVGSAANFQTQFVLNVLAFKLLPGLFWLASLFLVGGMLHRHDPEKALPNLLLLAWNPVMLYETWGNGHNDIVMIFWVLAAAWAISRQRYTLSILALVMGGLVKYIPILLLPAAGLIALRALPDNRRRLKFVLVTGLLVAALAALVYAPFWNGADILTIGRRTRMFSTSLPAVLYNFVVLDWGQAKAADRISQAALALTGLFALLQGWLAMAAWRPGEPPEQPTRRFVAASFGVLAFYLLLTCLWFQQWYTVWLIGLLPLLPAGFSRRLTLLFGFSAVIAKQFIFIPFLLWPKPNFTQPLLETLFALGVFGVSWVYCLWHVARAGQKVEQQAPKPV